LIVVSILFVGTAKESNPAGSRMKFLSALFQIRGSVLSTATKPIKSFCQMIGAARKERTPNRCKSLPWAWLFRELLD
jgi:hypothetical protein